MARYQTEFYDPLVADWSNFGTWTENGAVDATSRATGIWQRIPASDTRPPVDADRVGALREYVERHTELGGAAPVS